MENEKYNFYSNRIFCHSFNNRSNEDIIKILFCYKSISIFKLYRLKENDDVFDYINDLKNNDEENISFDMIFQKVKKWLDSNEDIYLPRSISIEKLSFKTMMLFILGSIKLSPTDINEKNLNLFFKVLDVFIEHDKSDFGLVYFDRYRDLTNLEIKFFYLITTYAVIRKEKKLSKVIMKLHLNNFYQQVASLITSEFYDLLENPIVFKMYNEVSKKMKKYKIQETMNSSNLTADEMYSDIQRFIKIVSSKSKYQNQKFANSVYLPYYRRNNSVLSMFSDIDEFSFQNLVRSAIIQLYSYKGSSKKGIIRFMKGVDAIIKNGKYENISIYSICDVLDDNIKAYAMYATI